MKNLKMIFALLTFYAAVIVSIILLFILLPVFIVQLSGLFVYFRLGDSNVSQTLSET